MIKLDDLNISEGHKTAVRIIIDQIYPYADDRNMEPIIEQLITDRLEQEAGRLGKVVNGKWSR